MNQRMNQSKVALAVLGVFAGAASAQSSVSLSGVIDLNAEYLKNDGSPRRYSLGRDGRNDSELRFRGSEDLGGGLWADFHLRSGVNADTGTSNSKFYNRQSTVSLRGNFGEIRLGRDYTPLAWNQYKEPYGGVGIANSLNAAQMFSGSRMDNSIGYFLPSNIGGVHGQAMVAAGEGGTTADRPGRLVAGRIGFASGSFDIAAAYGQQRFFGSPNDQKTINVGGTYDFGVVKLFAYIDRETRDTLKENRLAGGVRILIGVSEVRIGYTYSKLTNSASTLSNKVGLPGVGYSYNLSKRTVLYATAARLSNGGDSLTGSQLSLPAGTTSAASTARGGKSTGAQFGIAHFF